MAKQRKTRRVRKHRGGEANQMRSRLRNNINKAKALKGTVKNNNLAKKLNNSIVQAEKLASETNNSNPEMSLKEEMNIKANNLEKLLASNPPINSRNTHNNYKKEMERKRNEEIKQWVEEHKKAKNKDPQARGVNNETSRWDPFVATQH